MYIFNRIRTIDPGRTPDATAGAVELTAKINQMLDLTVHTWHQQYAPTGPAIAWTARLDHLEDFDTANEALLASSEIQDMAAELEESLTGPVVDHMVELVGGTPPSEPAPIVTAIQAQAANGHLRAAMHWGLDLAERFSAAMDVPTVFGRGLFGDYGMIIWASYFQDMSQLEGTQAKLAVDEMLQAAMDEGAHNCREGAQAALMRRLD